MLAELISPPAANIVRKMKKKQVDTVDKRYFNYEAETKRNEYPLSLVWARWGWVVVILSPEIKYFLS